MRRLAVWYDYRIVNVNVNIILAGVVAMGITVAAMHAAEVSGLLERMAGWVGRRNFRVWGYELQGEKFVVSGLTFVVDLVADVLVYYGLHWVANHMPRKGGRNGGRGGGGRGAYADLSFVRDATLVQFERALISPVLYIAALGLQSKLLHEGRSVAFATWVGFTVGLILTRVLHTMWMLRMERRAGRTSAADVVGPDHGRPERSDEKGG